jgi:HK97 gp10 family phage protein
MAFVKARLEGVEKALKALGDVSRTVRNKVLRKAVNASSRVVLAAAKSLVPRGTGMLRRSLAVRVQTYRASGKVVGIIGPRTGTSGSGAKRKQTSFGAKMAQTGQNPAKYAHLVEFGRATVSVSKAKVLSDGSTIFGRSVKAVPPRPFLRPAFESNKSAVVAQMGEIIAAEIERLAKSLKGAK